MPDDDVVQFKSPTTGVVQPVPPEHWQEALDSGYQPTTHKVMYSPAGERGMVPNEQLHDYVKQGYQTTPKTKFEKNVTGEGISLKGAPGAAFSYASKIPGALLQSVDPTRGLSGAALTGMGINPRSGTVGERLGEVPLAGASREAQSEYQRSRQAGDNPLAAGASAGIAGVGSLFGASAEQGYQQAQKGEGGKIIGEAAVPIAMAAIPLAAEATGAAREGIGGAIRTPEGILKPGAKLTSQLGGAAIGGVAGEYAHPGYGGVAGLGAGYKAGPLAVEKFFPEPPSRVAARAATADQADIQAGLQQRRAAYAEMNEHFADQAKQKAADMQKRIAASEKRISAAEDARQKEITDWAKVDKINDADHQAFQDRMSEIEQERQKALADTEKLRTQHAQDLQNRGNQQAAMDASHAQDLADIEKTRQGDLAAQERLKLQHAEALNRRKGAKAPPAPPPNPFAGMTSTAPGAPLGNVPLPPAGPVPATIRMGTGIGAEQLATQQAPVSRQGMTPPPTPMPEPEGAPLSRPTVGSQIAARNKSQNTLLSRGQTLIQPGMEPDMNNPVHAKMIGDLQGQGLSIQELKARESLGDRFAAYVLRYMRRPKRP